MVYVDHLKGVSTSDLFLEVAFGRHIIQGDLAKSIVTGSSPNHVVTIQHLLGDAFGKGWSGPIAVWFRGTNRDSTKWKFYPGIMSPSNTDSTQGIDAVFDKDTPHSGTAWIRMECPNGSEVGIPDINTRDNPPTGFSTLIDCQLGDVYDSSGSMVSSDVLLVNPADVLIFGCLEIRRYDVDRIDFGSLDALRTLSDITVTPDYTTLPQGVGLRGAYYDGAAFTTLKGVYIDPVVQYDPSTGAPAIGLTPTSFAARFEGQIKFKFTETYTFYLTHNDSGKLWIDNLSTALINQSSAGTHSTTFSGTADTLKDIKLEWTNASGNSEFKLEWQSTSQPREVVPQDCLFPKGVAEPRFQANVDFIQRTTFDAFLRGVLFLCNGTFQDVDGKLRFFCLEDAEVSFSFDETNIVKDTLSFEPRYSQQEILALPNRFIADGRDLDNRYLEKFDPAVFVDDDELQQISGRIIEETVAVGNVTRWQALSNLGHYARLRKPALYIMFDGMPSTLPVMQGDVVEISISDLGWVNKRCLVIEATDKSVDSGADTRIFKLMEW